MLLIDMCMTSAAFRYLTGILGFVMLWIFYNKYKKSKEEYGSGNPYFIGNAVFFGLVGLILCGVAISETLQFLSRYRKYWVFGGEFPLQLVFYWWRTLNIPSLTFLHQILISSCHYKFWRYVGPCHS